MGDNFTKHRRGHHAAIHGFTRLVDHDQHQITRVLQRRYAHKRGHARAAVAFARRFLGRAGFAAHHQARNADARPLPGAALFHHLAQHGQHHLGRLAFEHLFAGIALHIGGRAVFRVALLLAVRRVGLVQLFPAVSRCFFRRKRRFIVAVRSGVATGLQGLRVHIAQNQLERPPFPAGGQGEVSLGHLQARGRKTLAKGGVDEVGFRPLLGRAQDAHGLAGNGQAGFIAKTQMVQVVVITFSAQEQADFGRANVAGIRQYLGQGQIAVTVRIADGGLVVLPYALFTIKHLIGLDHALGQGRGHQKRLDGGPLLQGVHGQTAAPHGRLIFAVGIGVEERILGPGQNFTRGHVHHQAAAPFAAKLDHGLGQGVLGEILNLGVQGQTDVLTHEAFFLAQAFQIQAPPGGVALHGQLAAAAA